MLRLRPFKTCDIPYILNWLKDERTFTLWSANRFTYPLTEEQLINHKRMVDEDPNAWDFVALNDEGTVIGFFIMRLADYVKESVRLGFIIVDPSYRGHGYGKEMLSLAKAYAFTILNVKQMTLGVFANNESAHRCYQSVGFKDFSVEKDSLSFYDEKWTLIEMVNKKA